VTGVSLAVQLVYLAEGPKSPTFLLPIVDAHGYHRAATRLAEGGVLRDGPFWQPPLFPALLGALYRVAGPDVFAARLGLAGLAVCSSLLLWWIGRATFSGRVGLWAGLIWAGYGPQVFFSTRLLPTGPLVVLTLAAVALLLWAMNAPRSARWLPAGLCVGLGIVTKPNVGVLLAVGLGWLAWKTRRGFGRRPALLAALLFLTGAIAPIAPVAFRNYRVSGDFVPVSTNGGINFFIGNNADTDATLAIRPGEYWLRLNRATHAEGVRSDAERSAYFFDKALEHARSSPLAFLGGMARKTAQVVNARELPRNADLYLHRAHSNLLAALAWRLGPFAFPFGLLAPLAAVGALISRSYGAPDPTALERRAVLGAFVVLYLGSVVLFFVTARYRLPALAIVTVFAAAGATWSWDQLRAGRERAVRSLRRAALATFALAFVVVNAPLSTALDRVDFEAELYSTVASGYRSTGDLDRARRFALRSLAVDPLHAAGHRELGTVLAAVGELGEAESHLRRAIEIDPNTSQARWLLGDLLGRQGRYAEAIEVYEAALEIDPTCPEAHVGLGDALDEVGRPDAALSHYETASAVEEQPASVYLKMGLLLEKRTDCDGAERAYRRALARARQSDMKRALLNRIASLPANCPNRRVAPPP
jgi:tetratricopeptide (TPR) repeat protein